MSIIERKIKKTEARIRELELRMDDAKDEIIGLANSEGYLFAAQLVSVANRYANYSAEHDALISHLEDLRDVAAEYNKE